MSKLLTVKLVEAEERTGLSARSIKDLIHAGKVEGTKPSKEILVYWQSLVDYMERNKIIGKKSKAS